MLDERDVKEFCEVFDEMEPSGGRGAKTSATVLREVFVPLPQEFNHFHLIDI